MNRIHDWFSSYSHICMTRNIVISGTRSLPRILIVLLLYPWIVSFSGSPRDSLSTKVSIYGGLGQYDYITRDCNNQITSVTQIPFQEAAGTIEGPIDDWLGYKLRGGYLNAPGGHGLFRERTIPYQTGYYGPVDTYQPDGYYGGVTLRLHADHLGLPHIFGLDQLDYVRLDIGGIISNRVLAITPFDNQKYSATGGLRFGFINGSYMTFDFYNDDPLLSSRALGSFGVGFPLGSLGHTKRARRQSTLWFGLGAFPYDGLMVLSKATIPFEHEWTAEFSASVSTAANFEGAFSGGLGYSW